MKLLFMWAVALAFIFIAPACTSARTQSGLSTAPPASVSYHAVHGGKPPMRIYTLQLDLVNREDQPKWIVMRYYLDEALPTSDRLVAGKEDWLQFGDDVLSQRERANVYQRDRAASRTVECIGRFRALLLPAHGELRIADCQLEARESVRQFEIWEASDIVINRTTPLQQWIAARKLAPEGIYATSADSDRAARPSQVMDHAAPLPEDIVSSIEFREVRRWTLPITQVEKQPRDPWSL